jgi:indolepyruvate ferredoxin oxidoreductase
VPVFRILRACRRLRGILLDPFGAERSRREERDLIVWYNGLLDAALAALRPATAMTVLAIAELPDQIRGYESLKSDSASLARALATQLRDQRARPPLPLLL